MRRAAPCGPPGSRCQDSTVESKDPAGAWILRCDGPPESCPLVRALDGRWIAVIPAARPVREWDDVWVDHLPPPGVTVHFRSLTWQAWRAVVARPVTNETRHLIHAGDRCWLGGCDHEFAAGERAAYTVELGGRPVCPSHVLPPPSEVKSGHGRRGTSHARGRRPPPDQPGRPGPA